MTKIVNRTKQRHCEKTIRQISWHKLAALYLLAAIACLPLSIQAQELQDPAETVSATDYYEMAQQALRQGLSNKAERFYHRALFNDATLQPAYLGLIDLYIAQKRYNDGLTIIDKGLVHFPDNADLWVRQGMIYRDKKEINAAREAYNKAMTLAPEDPHILQRSAGFFKMTNDSIKAESLSQKSQTLKMDKQ